MLNNSALLLKDKQPEDICTLHRESTRNMISVESVIFNVKRVLYNVKTVAKVYHRR